MRTALTLRIVLSCLGVVLGIALIAHGNVPIGALIIAMAVVRMVLMISRIRHRRERLVRFAQRRQRMPVASDRARFG